MKKMKRALVLVMAVVIAMTATSINADAASKVKLNKKKVTLTITDKKPRPTVTLKLKGSYYHGFKQYWSGSDDMIATVKNGKVTAKCAGKVNITCYLNGTKYTCKVTIKDKSKALKVAVKQTGDNIKKENYELAKGLSNSQIKVTYKGKDVTKKAKFGMQLGNEGHTWTYKDMVDKNGDMHLYGPLHPASDLKLIVDYKKIRKIVKLKVTSKKITYYQCLNTFMDENRPQCGYIADTMEELGKHIETTHGKSIVNWDVVYYYVAKVTKR